MLIVNGSVLDATGQRTADVRVGADGRVAEVAPGLQPSPGEETIDASGCLVLAGGVDVHSHLNLPVGQVRVSDDFATGTAAAAVGGTTTIIDYITTARGQDPLEALAMWRSWGEPAAVDYGLHMTFTGPASEQTVVSCIEQGVTSFKLYMAYPASLQVDDGVVFEILSAVGRHGGLVTTHSENGPAIEALRRRALAEGRTAVIEHARTRPAELEAEAVARVATLAELAKAPVYIVHISSARALDAVRAAKQRGADMFGETCPQYLYLTDDLLAGPDGADFVCTPPLRRPDDQEKLWEGLGDGTIDTVATDHCPFWRADRRRGLQGRSEGFSDFTEVPGGLPGVETRMALMWQGVRNGRITAAEWARLCCEAPAKLFGLWPRKGSIEVGADADVVVWDPEARQSLDAERLHMRVDHSPYEGQVVTGWPRYVFSRGRLVARHGEPVGEQGWGQYLLRQPRTGAVG
ncbi:MAG TPA: dihydropyrimidinase [Acidimicrobiales bacterium]|nr:dihydropyrimidinase [Acidimicrobiales bacterium]